MNQEPKKCSKCKQETTDYFMSPALCAKCSKLKRLAAGLGDEALAIGLAAAMRPMF